MAPVRVASRVRAGDDDGRIGRVAVDRHRRLTQPPVLETARLRLRALRADDLDAFSAIWADTRVTTFIGGTPRPRAEVWTRMLATEGHWRWFGYGYWGVERNGTLIGNAGFASFERAIDPPLDAPEIGWAFAADCWGQGYASEVVLALVDWADARGWDRTVAIIDPGNLASARVAVKAGYCMERVASYAGTQTHVFARA